MKAHEPPTAWNRAEIAHSRRAQPDCGGLRQRRRWQDHGGGESGRRAGAIIVTTPSSVSLEDARKAVHMFHQVKVPIIGLVENMSYLVLPGTDSPGNGVRALVRF